MKYRVLLDIHWVDLLVEADSEEEARDKVFAHYRKERPFGGRPRMMQARVRKPWKHQLEASHAQDMAKVKQEVLRLITTTRQGDTT